MANARIQQRYDTAANWTSNDFTLLAGEQGIESDTGKFKFGDGSTAWTSLAYGKGRIDTSGTPVDNDFAKFTDADTIEGRSYAETLSDLSAEATSAFDMNGQDITNGGVVFLTEQASAEADVAGKGQVWTKTATPNELWFTNDAGTDAQLGVAGGAHAILDGSVHNDSVADAVTRGSIIYGNATPKWDELIVGSNGQVLTTDGTDISWGAAGTGDVTKVGTPANDQVGVWTGDGTIEGDGDLTFAGQTLTIGTVDTDEGILVLNADIDAGGKIQLHVEGDSDTTIVSFDIAPVDDDLHIGPSTDTDMLKFNDSTSIQATKPFIGTNIDATLDFTIDGLVLTADTVTNDAALTITTGAGDISLTPAAAGDVNIPVNIGLHFGDGGEKIESDDTDMTITSGGLINLSATGGVQLIEDMPILLDQTLSGDAKYCGIAEKGTAGAALAIGDICYLQTADTRWELAGSDNGATGHNFKLGMCVQTAAGDASATTMLLYGKIRSATLPALTVGAPVYLGTTLGDVQVAAPSGSTDIVRIVGYGNTAEDLFFNPENDWITLT